MIVVLPSSERTNALSGSAQLPPHDSVETSRSGHDVAVVHGQDLPIAVTCRNPHL